MAVVARINDALGIRIHEYFGAVAPSELLALADFYQQNPNLVRADIISLIDENAAVAATLSEHLPSIRERFRALHQASDFVLVRRSAWVCPNPSAWPLLEKFLHERHSRDGQGSEVCLVAAIQEATCLFEPDEIAAVRAGEGFRFLFAGGGSGG